jgi:hypothetical protein
LPKSKCTKAAILAEAKQYAALQGVNWRPALARMSKGFLTSHLLVEAGYQEHAHQARVLIHTSLETQYMFDEFAARRLLDSSYKLPSTELARPEQKQLSKNLRKRLARRKAAQKKNNDKLSREGLRHKGP